MEPELIIVYWLVSGIVVKDLCLFTWVKTYRAASQHLFHFDVRGSVQHSTNLTQKPNKMQQCIRIYYFIFKWSSKCFWRHTAHYQEPKTAQAASGFACVEGFWTWRCWTLLEYTLPDSVQQLHVQQPSTHAKPEAACAVLCSWWWAVCRPKHVELHINMK